MFSFYDLSPAPLTIKDVPGKEPTAVSSADGEMTVVVVDGSSTVQVVEGAVGVEVSTTTGVVVEAEVATTIEMVAGVEAKMVSDAAEASGQGRQAIAPGRKSLQAFLLVPKEELALPNQRTRSMPTLSLISSACLSLWDLLLLDLVLVSLTQKIFPTEGMLLMTRVSKRCGGTESERSMN